MERCHSHPIRPKLEHCSAKTHMTRCTGQFWSCYSPQTGPSAYTARHGGRAVPNASNRTVRHAGTRIVRCVDSAIRLEQDHSSARTSKARCVGSPDCQEPDRPSTHDRHKLDSALAVLTFSPPELAWLETWAVAIAPNSTVRPPEPARHRVRSGLLALRAMWVLANGRSNSWRTGLPVHGPVWGAITSASNWTFHPPELARH